MSKTPYVSDKKHGAEEWRYENGTKWSEAMWRDGKQHGLETGRHENGQKEWEIYFIAGKVCARIEWNKERSVIEVNFPNTVLNPEINPARKLKNHIKNKIS